MLFENWTGLARVLLVGVLAYAALVLLLRVSGKRTLSKMNAFDLVVTVSLGSTLATALLSQDVPLAEAVLGFGVLIGMQFVVTWLSVRSVWVRRMVKAEPQLLYASGEFLEGAMRRSRVTRDEVRAAARAQGHLSMGAVHAVVLETDASFSVLSRSGEGGADRASTLKGVREAQLTESDARRESSGVSR